MKYVNIGNVRVNLEMISAYEVSNRNERGHDGIFIYFTTPSSYHFCVWFPNEAARTEAIKLLDKLTQPRQVQPSQ